MTLGEEKRLARDKEFAHQLKAHFEAVTNWDGNPPPLPSHNSEMAGHLFHALSAMRPERRTLGPATKEVLDTWGYADRVVPVQGKEGHYHFLPGRERVVLPRAQHAIELQKHFDEVQPDGPQQNIRPRLPPRTTPTGTYVHNAIPGGSSYLDAETAGLLERYGHPVQKQSEGRYQRVPREYRGKRSNFRDAPERRVSEVSGTSPTSPVAGPANTLLPNRSVSPSNSTTAARASEAAQPALPTARKRK